MKKAILFVILISLIFAGYILAAKEDIPLSKRWEKVNELAEKQLPESALKEVEAILAQARKDKNSVEVIKAMVYKMRFTLEKTPDEASSLIKDFEAFTLKSTDPAERALLHSMTAELYTQYYQKDQWTINNRTEIIGLVPEDMKEWTKNIYFDKITKHLAASLENPTILQKTDALKFSTLFIKGKDSRDLQPTLFDFLGNRKIAILNDLSEITNEKNPLENSRYFLDINQFIVLPIDTAYHNSIGNQIFETYQKMLAYRLKVGNAAALMNLDLERLEYFRTNAANEQSDSLYLEALSRLENEYSNNESVVEVLAEKASYYYDKSGNVDDETSILSPEAVKLKRKAYDICADGIKRFPNYKRIGVLVNIQREITRKNIDIAYNKETPSTLALKVKVTSSNISTVQLTVYRVNATAQKYNSFLEKEGRSAENYPDRTIVETKQVSIKPDPNFGNVDSQIDIRPQGYGIFEFTIEEAGNVTKEKRTKGNFVVTDLAYLGRSTTNKQESIYVLNRQSGQPQSDVSIEVYSKQWTGNGYSTDFKGVFKTGNDGLIRFPFETNYFQNTLYLAKGKDCYFSTSNTAYFRDKYRFENENENARVSFFTDRSIYRPGQTVSFKGIAFYSNSKKQKATENEKFTVTMINATGQQISSKDFTTNEFGSFAGEFVLPEGGLNGAFRIQTEGGSQTIWVEEYKCPTFEAMIDKPKDEIQFGDKVTLKGTVKAYAGYNVGDANVKYRVVRRVHHFCWWFNEPEEEIVNGITKSDKDGNFEVAFVPAKSKSKFSFIGDRAYSYTVYTDVTDLKGETQQGEQTISVGDKSLFIIADVPETWNKAKKVSIAVSTENINDEKVNSVMQYSLYRLAETDVYSENLAEGKDLKMLEKVVSGRFDTKDQKMEFDLKGQSSGRYKLILTTQDAHGKEVKLEKTIILYGTDDKESPVKSYVWLLTPKTTCGVDEIAKIQFGTSTTNTQVLYEVMQGNKVLESRWVAFSNEIKTFEIPFEQSYGAGVTVMFTFMKDEQLFTRSIQINRRIVEKKLTPTLSVFRNKLLPGEKAEWTITVPESATNKKATELLVGMYDASLDAIRSHNWFFNPGYVESIEYSPLWQASQINMGSGNVYFDVNYIKVPGYEFNQLNWFGLEISEYNQYRQTTMRKSAAFTSIATVIGGDDVNGKDIADIKEVVTQSVEEKVNIRGVSSISDALQGKVAGITVNEHVKSVKVRTNFNETAFFYPQLHTYEKGNVKFTFTAPESLTRWNVKMLAHTPDLYFGQREAQVVTQKDLMVQMNMPRFVRRSDKLVLSANVINLTDKLLNATVQFEMMDPATGKSIKLKEAAPKTILLAANETKAVEWELTEFSPYELVICKVIAQAGNFSDGEQKYLPVLPDKLLVTEGLPLTIRGNQTRTFNFESLLKSGSKVDTKNLSVEFSSNPAWYAVQALPTISTPEDDNALDYFTAYYANSLAAFIANSNPKIAATFDRWKKAGGSREALLSNLEKNAELKNMLLAETPWVMAAKDETEQKRQIALLFDLNMQKNQAQQYLDKLLALQMPLGAFSWFKGMGESRYVTQEIVLNIGRLSRLTGQMNDKRLKSSIESALHYLDFEIAMDFKRLKKNNPNYEKEMCVDNIQLFYLHAHSEFPYIPVSDYAQEAVKFYTAQSEKYWTNFTLYGKAMMAVVANRNGKTQLANDILKSLKENALKTDEFGMYWAKNTSGYFWNERPIAVQAAIIEAFTEISKNTSDVDELKIWLLKQKQTQRWDSPMATVDAIYALLNQGSDWLSNEGSVKIKVGNKTLQPGSTEAGTGYFKETIPVTEVRSEMGKVTVNKTDKGIGWGAMYWQYYQDLDKIQGQSGPMKITKKLFVEKMTASGKTMIPIEQTELHKGDKVITRLVITTDRNLEFVALKDLRASCFEPVNQLSGCEWKENVCYYQTTKDASTQFFFSFLPKGTYVFEYGLWVNAAGEYTSGIASIQCQYAPEFVSHTGGERIQIK
jgi:uncharacterized protein YfaS (alpha-2-macroglobulin family)